MSTLPSRINEEPAAWKQEVSRLVVAHQSRKGPVRVEPEQSSFRRPTNGRAAEAMARVAARYANAPSYHQALAGEARAVARAAEAASRAAAEVHAAAERLADLHAATVESAVFLPEEPLFEFSEPTVEPSVAPQMESLVVPAAAPEPVRRVEPQAAGTVQESLDFAPENYTVRWEEALPRQPEAPETQRGYEVIPEGWREENWRDESREAVEEVEAGQPIPGNLIEFPRELVATRKMRPRLAEGPLVEEPTAEAQLSIFEVDPASVSAVAEEPSPVPSASGERQSIWEAPEWRDLELSAEPEETVVPRRADALLNAEPRLDAAPAGMRILSVLVNGSLLAAALLAAAAASMHFGLVLTGVRAAESALAGGLVTVALFYTALFYVLGDGTPGMRYAHLRLTTFEGRRTTRTERMIRLLGLALSVLPLGLGLAWILFDEEGLCWHDRLSRTYLRRY